MRSNTAQTSETTVSPPPKRHVKGNGGIEIKAKSATVEPRAVVIAPPKFETAIVRIVGAAPYVQHKFSQKSRTKMEETQRMGSRAKKGQKREPRDFESDYLGAMHRSHEGWCGIPAPAFRNAMISACRLAGFVMTRAKLALFVVADGLDPDDGTPLVRIYGEPRCHQSFARNDNGGTDLRWRPMWETWHADVHLRWDADQFSAGDVVNLLARAGLQVGIGEGRPDSPDSNGLGWGLFTIEGEHVD